MALVIPILLALFLQQDPAATPKWEDYPTSEPIWKGPNAAPKLVRADERMFQTRITNAAKEPPDFAGHYRFADWGCGSVCAAGALIDLKTGAIYPPPKIGPPGKGWSRWIFAGGIVEGPYLETRPGSRLAITRHQKQNDMQTVRYWEWTGSAFRLLRERTERKTQ